MAFDTLFFSVRLGPALVASATRATLQKAHYKEDGLQETNGKANADARRRTGIFLGLNLLATLLWVSNVSALLHLVRNGSEHRRIPDRSQ